MDQYRLEVAKNAAANGRVFCVMLFAACLAAYLVTRDSFYLSLAIVASFPVALAYLGDLHGGAVIMRVVFWLNIVIPLAVILNLLAV